MTSFFKVDLPSGVCVPIQMKPPSFITVYVFAKGFVG